MSVRCKFKLTSSKQQSYNPADRELEFAPQYDTSIPEDQSFAKFTPSGSFKMICNNPAALAQLELGKDYYFDITACEPLKTE